MINTKRLEIHLADENEMINFIENVKISELKIAYNEMLEESKNHPDKKEWYAMWMIELTDKTHIGELCFKGINSDGSAEIGYGIEEKFQNCGYATEAVNAVVKWALSQNGITKIIAQTDYENIASQKVLEKCGFVSTGKTGEEGPVYEKKEVHKMKRELGIARCGLACCLCSENTHCNGCYSDECDGSKWCENRKCSIEKNLNGCFECTENCTKGLLGKIKPRTFRKFIQLYGKEKLLDCLEENENKGIVYHREGINGDYDDFDDEDKLIEFILTGEKK